MKNILVGINFSSESAIVLNFAQRLAQYHGVDLVVVHVLDYKDSAVMNLREDKHKANSQAMDEFSRQKLEQLEEFAWTHHTKQYHDVELKIIVNYGYPQETLRKIAHQQNCSLIVVGKLTKSKERFFADVPDQLIDWSPCPVFIVPEEAHFHAFQRMVYATNFILEDCASILYLKPWLAIFDAELICLHICKDQEDQRRAKRKMEILRQLFPQDNITFRTVISDVETGIDRYVNLTKSDLVATTHRNRNFWENIFDSSTSKAIARDVAVPMLIFQKD